MSDLIQERIPELKLQEPLELCALQTSAAEAAQLPPLTATHPYQYPPAIHNLLDRRVQRALLALTRPAAVVEVREHPM